jgi:hypothetical protein
MKRDSASQNTADEGFVQIVVAEILPATKPHPAIQVFRDDVNRVVDPVCTAGHDRSVPYGCEEPFAPMAR